MDNPATVLLLEENADTLESMQRHLQGHGYRVLTAQDAQRGLELVEKRAASAVVMDLLLPGMSGFRLLEKLKSGPNPPRVIVVSCIGHIAQSSLAQFLGADEFIRRPFSLNRLSESVARFCPAPAFRHEGTGPPHLLDKVGVHGGS